MTCNGPDSKAISLRRCASAELIDRNGETSNRRRLNRLGLQGHPGCTWVLLPPNSRTSGAAGYFCCLLRIPAQDLVHDLVDREFRGIELVSIFRGLERGR